MTYTYPVFGDLPIAAADVGLLLKVIKPIWTAKADEGFWLWHKVAYLFFAKIQLFRRLAQTRSEPIKV